MADTRHGGVTREEIRTRFEVSHRRARAPVFDFEIHAAGVFASYHDPARIGPVAGHFSPRAAPPAQLRFHRDQEIKEEPDGSPTVRFKACGWLEMA